MPVYEYGCEAGHRFEVTQKFSDRPITACQTCAQPVSKLISAPAIMPGNWTVGSNPTLSAIVSRHAWKNRKGAGPCAKGTFEPRQVRKEATVRRPSFVPQDHLAPVFRRR